MTISVRQAKALARQWVFENASNDPGFVGAYFSGSITYLSEDADFPQSSDVDLHLVYADLEQLEPLGKFRYRDIILEVSRSSVTQIGSADSILGNYHQAGTFRGPFIIVDRTGQITELQQSVSRDFAKRQWVYQRCDHARQNVLAWLDRIDPSDPFSEQVAAWLFAAGVLTHVLLVAGLKNPTVRRRYLAARELLAEYDQLDFYEKLLEIQGSSLMSRERVQHHLNQLAETFDYTKTIVETPYRFAADISDDGRPIAIGGSEELIEQGFHREAVFWIVATQCRCQAILHNDAPEEMQKKHERGFRELVSDLGITSFADLERRREQIENFLPDVWEVAETIIAENPQIDS